MSKLTARQRSRMKSQFPLGRFAAVLTVLAIIFAGVITGVDPVAILLRASVSAIAMGFLVSFGVGVVRMLNREHEKVHGNHSR